MTEEMWADDTSFAVANDAVCDPSCSVCWDEWEAEMRVMGGEG